MWSNDSDFNKWLDAENLGTDDFPLDDDTLELMYKAWLEGNEKYEGVLRYIVSLDVDNIDKLTRKELEYKLTDAVSMARMVLGLSNEEKII